MAETFVHAVPEETHASHAHHPELSFFRKYIWSEDHKTIALQYLFTSLAFLLVGGLLAMGVRFQLAFPNAPVPFIGTLLPSWLVTSSGAIQPGGYNGLVTMHATVTLVAELSRRLVLQSAMRPNLVILAPEPCAFVPSVGDILELFTLQKLIA